MIYLFIISSRSLFCMFLFAAQRCFMLESSLPLPCHPPTQSETLDVYAKKRRQKKHKEQWQSGIQSWILSGFVFWIDKFQNDTINRWYNSNNVPLCILWLYFLLYTNSIGYRSCAYAAPFHSDAWINEEISNKLGLRSWDSLSLWLIVF